MTLRMVFERDDLQKVRLASAADPMWELVLSLFKARATAVPAPFVGWRQDLQRRLGKAGDKWHSLMLLQSLLPTSGNFPDSLTPHPLVTDLDSGCEALACTTPTRWTDDLNQVFRGYAAPSWARSLARVDREQVHQLVTAVRDSHDLLIAPQWGRAQEVVNADRTSRVHELTTHGLSALLVGVPGILGWNGEVLHIRYPEDRTVHLHGRGLTLLPSYFCWGNPVTWIDPTLPPVLVYQARRNDLTSDADTRPPQHLASLLGHTRAECLLHLLNSLTTSELASRLATTVGAASKQTTILRQAGLITSTRHGPAVLHHVTPLGAALLTGTLRTC